MIVTAIELLKECLAQFEANTYQCIVPPFNAQKIRRFIDRPKTATLYRMDYFTENWIQSCLDLGTTHHRSEVDVILL